MAKNPTKWGILSSGKISWDFVNALKTCERKDEHDIIAVSARDISRAQDFAKKFGIPKAYGSKEELGNDLEVEVNHFNYSLMKSDFRIFIRL